MAQLTKATCNAREGAVTRARSSSARRSPRGSPSRSAGIAAFRLRTRQRGARPGSSLTSISLNLYPLAKYGTKLGTPEYSMTLLARARKLLGYGGVPASKPIWNTEVNYGMRTGSLGGTRATSDHGRAPGGVRAADVPAQRRERREAGPLVHLEHGHPGLGRDPGKHSSDRPPDGRTLTLAGKALGLARSWMIGGTLVGPSRSAAPLLLDGRGTYTCVITYANGVRASTGTPRRRSPSDGPKCDFQAGGLRCEEEDQGRFDGEPSTTGP